MTPPTLDGATVEKLLSAAVAAPSIHNTQPWRYRLDPETATFEVREVPERSLRYADPRGRALHVSVGASLFNLRVAVRHAGWEPQVSLLPAPRQPDLLATVHLGPGDDPSEEEAGRYDAVWRRHSSRRPFSADPLPDDVRDALIRAAAAEGATLRFPGRTEAEHMLRLTAEAERRNETDLDRRAESRRWVRDAGSDGLPFPALGPQDATHTLPMRAFSGPGPGGRPGDAPFEQRPTVAELSTPDDGRLDWLRGGQALEHVLLAATMRSVRASLLYQAVEWPDLRAALRPDAAGLEYPQTLLRFGYGPEGPATPRRRVRDVLERTDHPR